MEEPSQTTQDAGPDEMPGKKDTKLVDALNWLMSATGGQYVCRVQHELVLAPGAPGFVLQYWARIDARWIEPVLGWGQSAQAAAADAHRIFAARRPDLALAAHNRPPAQTVAPAGIQSQAAVGPSPESKPPAP